METLSTINFLMAAVFAACYCYQVVFAVARRQHRANRRGLRGPGFPAPE